jgi:hypothetical protein
VLVLVLVLLVLVLLLLADRARAPLWGRHIPACAEGPERKSGSAIIPVAGVGE